MTFRELYDQGNQLRKAGMLQQAEAAYRAALEQNPGLVEAWNNLALVLEDLGNNVGALKCYENALRIAPRHRGIWTNVGQIYYKVGQPSLAIEAYQRELANEASPQTYHNLAVALTKLDRIDEAIECQKKAVSMNPRLPLAWGGLGHAFMMQSRIDEAIGAYQKAVEIAPDYIEGYGDLLFSLEYHPDYAGKRAWEFQARFREAINRLNIPRAQLPEPQKHDKIRVGFLSADLRFHLVARGVYPLFKCHDRDQFAFYAYNVGPCDAMTEKLKCCVEFWRDAHGISDAALVEMIARDDLDLLFDLSLFTWGARPRVIASKPARVIAQHLGYPGRTGNPAVDFRVTDSLICPVGSAEPDDRERPMRLADCYWCLDSMESGCDPAWPDGRLTLGCFANSQKFNGRDMALWSRVLTGLPEAVFRVVAYRGRGRDWILREMQNNGVAPDRIEFLDYSKYPEYMRNHQDVHLMLDTFPYNAPSTAIDALWMGVPVVSRFGDCEVSRGVLSVLSQVGLSDFACPTDDEFVRFAVEKARDLEGLKALRFSLRDRMMKSPLMDSARYARNMESLILRMVNVPQLTRP